MSYEAIFEFKESSMASDEQLFSNILSKFLLIAVYRFRSFPHFVFSHAV